MWQTCISVPAIELVDHTVDHGSMFFFFPKFNLLSHVEDQPHLFYVVIRSLDYTQICWLSCEYRTFLCMIQDFKKIQETYYQSNQIMYVHLLYSTAVMGANCSSKNLVHQDKSLLHVKQEGHISGMTHQPTQQYYAPHLWESVTGLFLHPLAQVFIYFSLPHTDLYHTLFVGKPKRIT